MGGKWGRGGEGSGEEGGNGASEARRRGRGVGEEGGKDRGRERGWGGRGRRGRGRETRGGAKGGGEGELARLPVDAGVVACQPGEPKNELKVAERHDVAGKAFGMGTVNPKMRGAEVDNRTSGRNAAVDKLKRDGDGVGLGGQLMCNEDGGIQETV